MKYRIKAEVVVTYARWIEADSREDAEDQAFSMNIDEWESWDRLDARLDDVVSISQDTGSKK